MKKSNLKNIKSHHSLSLAKANASKDIQINFNQAEDALTIPAESRHDHKCGSATQSGRSLLPESGADAPTVLSAVYTDSTPAKNRQADVPQYGRSMIEMLGVLAIIGVLSVGGIAGYSKAMTKYRINKTIEQITLIAGNVRTFFAPQRSYDGLNSTTETGRAIIKKAKLVPDEMWDGFQIKTALGDPIVLSFDDISDGDKRAFVFYTNFDTVDGCIELLSQDLTTMGVKVIMAGCSEDSGYYKAPLSVDDAIEACNKCEGLPDINLYFDTDLAGSSWSGVTWKN